VVSARLRDLAHSLASIVSSATTLSAAPHLCGLPGHLASHPPVYLHCVTETEVSYGFEGKNKKTIIGIIEKSAEAIQQMS
jgi:hypothetical protein